MADHTVHDLNYGHLGHILYNPTDKVWLSRRALGNTHHIRPLAPSQWAVKPTESSLGDGSTAHLQEQVSGRGGVGGVGGGRGGFSQLARTQLPGLVRQFPALASVADFSASLAHLSQDVASITDRHEPTSGELLAFGRVSDVSARRTLQIAAFPARASATSLYLMQVQPQKQGWDHNKSVWIDVPRISGESGTWDALQPIRQLCFSAPSEESHSPTPYLAVRTTVAVHVLHLSLRKGVSSWDSIHNAPSRFRIAPVYTLSLDVLGAVPPADVSFNPFYDKQVATIDQHGTWRIWDLSYQTTGHHGVPLQVATGAAGDRSIASALPEGSVLDDGWGRVSWAADSSTIIAVSRRAIGVYDVGSKPMRLTSPDLGISGTPHWILDMQTSPTNPSVVFILTSVKIVCVRVQPLSNCAPDNPDGAGAHIVFQTHHFRDPEDISLRISTFVDAQDTVVVLRSSLSLVATLYRCTSQDTSTTPFLSVSDPILVNLPEAPAPHERLCPSLGLRIHAAEYGESWRGASGPGQEYRDSSVRFYMMTMLSSNMSVVEKLYFGQSGPLVELPDVLPTNWHSRVTYGAPRLQNDRFVVSDDYKLDQVGQGDVGRDKIDAYMQLSRHDMARNDKRLWTITYEQSYKDITRPHQDDMRDLSATLESIKVHLQEQDGHQAGIRTLLSDICKQHLSVSDLDEAAAQLRDLFATNSGFVGFQAMGPDTSLGDEVASRHLAGLSVARILGLPAEEDHRPNLMHVYETVINHWLEPLSPRVPGRVRLAKEQLARRVAAEVCMASCVLRGPELRPTQGESLVESQASAMQQRRPFLGSSQSQGTFPTPSPTATPSLTTVTSLSSHPSTLAAPEYLRLQKYVSFSPDKTTPAPLPKGLAKKLDHWVIGGNPEEYDWLATQRRQEKEAEEEDEDLTPRERARLKKRAEKHLRKQRRETLKTVSLNLASSQAPEIISTSQPAATLPRRVPAAGAASQMSLLSSSQPTQSQAQQQFPASQIEPGRFGGRAGPAKKKRKRNVGF